MLTAGLYLHITLGLNKLEEIQQEENVLQEHRNEILTNRNFKYTVDVTKEVTEDLERTTCITRNPDDEEDQVGMSSKCKICQQNVTWSEHKHRPSDIKYKTGTETRTAEEMKRKYLGAVEEVASSERLTKSIEESFKEVNFHILSMIMQAQQSFRRLDEIALKPNPLTQVEYLELLIESEKRELTAGWEQRIQHLEITKSAAEMLAKGKDERETQKLIESEKRKANPGWKQRIQYFEVAKRHAEMLSKVKNATEGSQQLMQEVSRDVDASEDEKVGRSLRKSSHGGDMWYSRFKFW